MKIFIGFLIGYFGCHLLFSNNRRKSNISDYKNVDTFYKDMEKMFKNGPK